MESYLQLRDQSPYEAIPAPISLHLSVILLPLIATLLLAVDAIGFFNFISTLLSLENLQPFPMWLLYLCLASAVSLTRMINLNQFLVPIAVSNDCIPTSISWTILGNSPGLPTTDPMRESLFTNVQSRSSREQ